MIFLIDQNNLLMLAIVMNIGVVGSGFMAHTWCLVAHDIPEVSAIAIFGGGNAQNLADRHKLRVCYSLDELLGDSEIDMVIITSPPSFHCEQTIAALSAGKHVLVEKPMALSVLEAEQMAECASRNSLTLGVVSQNRYRYSPMLAKKMMTDKELNLGSLKTILVKGQVERWWKGSTENSWKAKILAADPWMGWSSHACDLVNWFDESDPLNVCASWGQIAGVYETVVACVHYSSGTSAVFMLDHVESAPKNSPTLFFELRFDDGEIRFDTHGSLCVGKQGSWTTYGKELDKKQGQLSYTDDAVVRNPVRLNSYMSQLLDFVDAARSAREPSVGIHAGTTTQRVMDAVVEAAKENILVKISSKNSQRHLK